MLNINLIFDLFPDIFREVEELLLDVVGEGLDEEGVCRPPVNHGPGHSSRPTGSCQTVTVSVKRSSGHAVKVTRSRSLFESWRKNKSRSLNNNHINNGFYMKVYF